MINIVVIISVATLALGGRKQQKVQSSTIISIDFIKRQHLTALMLILPRENTCREVKLLLNSIVIFSTLTLPLFDPNLPTFKMGA